MIRDPETGWREATIVINGRQLSFAESMSLRVAVTSFRMTLSEPSYREGLGPVAEGYDACLSRIESMIMAEAR